MVNHHCYARIMEQPTREQITASSLKVLQFWNLDEIREIKKDTIDKIACQHLIENFTVDLWNALFENERYKILCENLPVP